MIRRSLTAAVAAALLASAFSTIAYAQGGRQLTLDQMLKDKSNCWREEKLNKETGIWEPEWSRDQSIRGESFTGFPGMIFNSGSLDTSVPNTTAIVGKPPFTYERLVKVPCRPPEQIYFGLEASKKWLKLGSKEDSASTGKTTNQFDDVKDPLGLGVSLGYRFYRGDWIVSPVASFNFLNQTIQHTFSGGSFMGTTTHWSLGAGARVGVQQSSGLFVYGRGGFSLANEDTVISFGGPVSNGSATVRGYTWGGGVEFAPWAWRRRNRPQTIVIEFEHASWGDAFLNLPAASPGFNYAFSRSDDSIKAGLNFRLK